jgi:hypothetical protein
MSCIPCQQAKALLNKSYNIIEGYSNLISSTPEIEQMAEARYKVCLSCSNKKPLIIVSQVQHYICEICVCPIDAKIRATNEVCPKGNW